MARKVPLSQGKFALVDDADFERVSQFKWTYDKGYAFRHVYRRDADGKWRGRKVSLHNFVMGAEQGDLIDHINRDPLDNRRCNLRRATKAQNNANSGPRGNAQYKGVTYHQRDGRWLAQITSGKTKRHLGNFCTAEAAAKAYDKAAFELWGQFAYLNFPNDLALP